VYGPSTLPQSVKLDLIGRGLAISDGNQAHPQRPALKDLRVTVGHYDQFPAFGQMVRVADLDEAFVDRFILPQVADQPRLHQKPAPASGEFPNTRFPMLAARFPSPATFIT
jgi:hypothetical protein